MISIFKKFPFRSFELIRRDTHPVTWGNWLSELLSPVSPFGHS